MIYLSHLGVLVNGFDAPRPKTAVYIWMFYPQDMDMLSLKGAERLNCVTELPIRVTIPLEKELEELVGDYSINLFDNESIKDTVHCLDWMGTAFEYIPDVEPRHRMFIPMILTSNPYWVDRTVWKEISNDALKTNIRLAHASGIASLAMGSGLNLFHSLVGKHL